MSQTTEIDPIISDRDLNRIRTFLQHIIATELDTDGQYVLKGEAHNSLTLLKKYKLHAEDLINLKGDYWKVLAERNGLLLEREARSSSIKPEPNVSYVSDDNDPWVPLIMHWLEDQTNDQISSADILSGAIGPDATNKQRLARAMRMIDGWQSTNDVYVNGRRCRGYARVK